MLDSHSDLIKPNTADRDYARNLEDLDYLFASESGATAVITTVGTHRVWSCFGSALQAARDVRGESFPVGAPLVLLLVRCLFLWLSH